jgi:hypothetical protein
MTNIVNIDEVLNNGQLDHAQMTIKLSPNFVRRLEATRQDTGAHSLGETAEVALAWYCGMHTKDAIDGTWVDLANKLREEALVSNQRDWDPGLRRMVAELTIEARDVGLHRVLQACAWAFLGFNPGYIDTMPNLD